MAQPLIIGFLFDSPRDLAWAAVLVLAVAMMIAKARNRRASLILTGFEVHRRPQAEDQPAVEIIGRPAGIIAFLLNLLQMQPQTRLSATHFGIEYERASLSGSLNTFIPLSRVASMAAGVHKPFGYLIAAGFLVVGGVFLSLSSGSVSWLLLALLISLFFVIGYFLSKNILFEITSNARLEVSLLFGPGIIEGVAVDAEKAKAAAGVIRDLILIAANEPRDTLQPEGGARVASPVAQAAWPPQSARKATPPPIDGMPPRNRSRDER